MRYKSWHAEGNSAAKPVLMCDGTQLGCSLLASSHYLTIYWLDAEMTSLDSSICEAVIVGSAAMRECRQIRMYRLKVNGNATIKPMNNP